MCALQFQLTFGFRFSISKSDCDVILCIQLSLCQVHPANTRPDALFKKFPYAEIVTHQTKQHFSDLLLSNLGEPVQIVASVSCS